MASVLKKLFEDFGMLMGIIVPESTDCNELLRVYYKSQGREIKDDEIYFFPSGVVGFERGYY